MVYETFVPHACLEAYINCFWHLETNHDVPQPEIVLPDGNLEIIIHFGDRCERMNAKGIFELQERGLFAGQLSQKTFLRPGKKAGMVGVRFKPAGASRFFKFPMSELIDQVPDLPALAGPSSKLLEDEILNAQSSLHRFNILQNFFIRRLTQVEENVFFQRACSLVIQLGTVTRIKAIAEEIGLSERQLERNFKEKVGITPKLLLRIRRLQSFLNLKQACPYMSLASVARTTGYIDLSHLSRDFHAFVGTSPSAYFQESHQISDNFTKKF